MSRLPTTILLLLVLASCRTDEELAVDAALAYVESVEIYNTPFRAYGYLSAADKAVVSADEFVAEAAADSPFKGGALALSSQEKRVDEIHVSLSITAPKGEVTQTRLIVVTQDPDKKWRVFLNRAQRTLVDAQIAKVQVLVDQGDIEPAHEILVPLNATPFVGTGADQVLVKLSTLGAEIERQRRVASISKAIDEAQGLEHEALADKIGELAKRVKPDEAAFNTRLDALRTTLAGQVKVLQIQKLQVTHHKVRRVIRRGNLEREAIIWFRNTLDRPLGQASVTINYLNEDGEEPVASDQHELLSSNDASLAPGEKREFVRRLETQPDWAGRLILPIPSDFQFAETK